MAVELDHFFILTESGAPQAQLLSGIGLIEGTANKHPDQGTANRRFFFTDSMLELLYLQNTEVAKNGLARPLRFAERATDSFASPFGIVVRTAPGSTSQPFPGWSYRPGYLKGDAYFRIGENSHLLEEPLCISMSFEPPQLLTQSLSPEPFTSVKELRISVPLWQPSRVLEALAQCDRISFQYGHAHLMEIYFNAEHTGRFADFRPELPLLIHW